MLKVSAAVLALAVLAACSTREPATPAPAPVIVTPAPVVAAPPPTTVVVPPTVAPAPTAIRPGFGRIESMTALAPTAAAGAGAKPMRRVAIKMDDGTVQYIDTPTQGMQIGDRVELTTDGYLRHPA
jgi:hypothetical protein